MNERILQSYKCRVEIPSVFLIRARKKDGKKRFRKMVHTPLAKENSDRSNVVRNCILVASADFA